MLMTAPGLAVLIVVQDDRNRCLHAGEVGRAESALAGGCGAGGDLSTVAQCWHVPQDKGQEEGSMGNLC